MNTCCQQKECCTKEAQLKKTRLEPIDIQSWDRAVPSEIQKRAVAALEAGKVLYFPTLPFVIAPNEMRFLSPDIADPKTKNISYEMRSDRLAGTLCMGDDADALRALIKRYALTSRTFLELLIPHYSAHLEQARTSFRPVEIFGRKSPSYRKDDTLRHVDAFPSSPTKGRRILRLFTNVNPEGHPRVWQLGEPFEDVVKKIAPVVPYPVPGVAFFLDLFRITKGYRTPYDHFMLQMHNIMKGDAEYQKQAPYEEIHFPVGSTWMVYTDQVSHAALRGRCVFEQTFHLPVEGLCDPTTAPLKVLERFFGCALV